MNIVEILTTNYRGTKWALTGNDYAGLEWLDEETPKPTEAELKKQWADVQYQTQLADVKAARHLAYTAPNGSDAVFMKYQRGEATKQEWLDAIQVVNDANPYPVK